MGALDFLFEGKPPESTTTYGTTVTDMPRWLSDYTQGLIGRANAIAGEGYQGYEGQRLAGLTKDQQDSFQTIRDNAGSYVPGMQQAQGAAEGAMTAAQPYFDKAGKTYTGDTVGEYMNPYVGNVIDRAALETNRNLNEKFLPGVANYFGAAGSGPRSTQMRRTVDQGVRDMTEGLHSQSLAALNDAYNSGAQTFGSDASRMGQLGTNVGGLSLDQSRTLGGLAETGQGLAFRDAAAQEAVGSQIQKDQQNSLDLAYNDFVAERDNPKNQTDWLSNVIRGTPTARSTTSTETGPAGDGVGPSPIGQLGSLATGIGGIMEMFKKARGGRVGGLTYAR